MKAEPIAVGLVLGVLIGGVGGLLSAPKSGHKSREVLQEKLGQIKNKIKRNHQEGSGRVQEGLASRDADYLH